ncbi:MAG: patatin-like phospholipase family protein [Trueperella sp.]|nr:patatin-like phospholipase family protein [Trueperella sp.]
MKISLVLGSGGPRGWAHIGVIQELTERGHEIATISGCSVGSLVGGVYAAGKLPEFTDWVLSLTKSNVRSLLDFTLTSPGLVKGERVINEIKEIVGEVNIEDLNIPYTAVAVDILSGREVWFQRGPLFLAIRSSISIPTFLTPVMIGDRLLVDGGVLNAVPVEPTLAHNTDFTVAVDLNGPALLTPHEVLRMKQEEERTLFDFSALGETWDRTKKSIMSTELFQQVEQRLFNEDNTDGDAADQEDAADAPEQAGGTADQADGAEFLSDHAHREAPVDTVTEAALAARALPEGLTTLGVMNLSLDVMRDFIQRYRNAAIPVPATIKIPKDAVDDMDYHRAEELIELGRKEAVKVFDEMGI